MPGSRKTTAASLFLPIAAASLVVFMVLYPETAFSASQSGLVVWWEVVFPALLPFFIGAQLLMGLGVVHFMGVIMEPLMRPLFNIPGSGSFVTAMGLASGYPIGSVLTGTLRREGMLTRAEGERLFSFSNTADPLFMAGAVAVGMFGIPEVAGVIMAAHYLSCLVVGLGLRFYQPNAPITRDESHRAGTVLGRSLRAMNRARAKDGRPFGQILGDSIRTSINTLLLIGGFIILFSVIIQVMNRVGMVAIMASGLVPLLSVVGLDPAVTGSLINGLFEITLGTQQAGAASAPLLDRLVAASMVIAWSGLSVHAQVAAMIHGTDMSVKPYVISRFFHAILAGLFTALLWGSPAAIGLSRVLPVTSRIVTGGLQGLGPSAILLSSAQTFA